MALAGLLGVAEIGLRIAGVTDFPLYDVDDGIGYVPKANQSGSFLRTRGWVYNDHSMGVAAAWNATGRPNLALIGNSIVMGGNPYDQRDKLGPRLADRLGPSIAVWPIAAGGWTNINECRYLERHPDVVAGTNVFIWEYMKGGLSALTPWPGKYFFPNHSPPLATWYLARRWMLLRIAHANDLPPTGSLVAENRSEFEAVLGTLAQGTTGVRPGLLLLYPTESELALSKQGKEWLPERSEIERIANKNGLVILDISKQSDWTASLYRDGTHPTVEGNEVLAKLLADAVKPLIGAAQGTKP